MFLDGKHLGMRAYVEPGVQITKKMLVLSVVNILIGIADWMFFIAVLLIFDFVYYADTR